jgi:hypothetical protein
MKYVLVTGGVVSGLGKGVTASSIGVVLKACGLRVTTIKIGSHSFPFLPGFLPAARLAISFCFGRGGFGVSARKRKEKKRKKKNCLPPAENPEKRADFSVERPPGLPDLVALCRLLVGLASV